MFPFKKLTTPENPDHVVSKGLKIAKKNQDSIDVIAHATTLATNLFLGKRVLEAANTAMITTSGFRDIISIGRQRRPELYDLYFEKLPPLIPRHQRFESQERINEEGKIITPLSIQDVKKQISQIREKDIDSIAICYLHSYVNPTHEAKTAELLEQSLGDIFITESHNVCPEHREYERFSTAVVNAVLKPQIWQYLQNISQNISRITKRSPPLRIMNNEGGLIEREEAVNFPVKLVESGPAAGVVGANYLAEKLKEEKVITFDMGGTTAKVGCIVGSPYITTEYEIGGEVHRGRIVKGSGYSIRLPFIDLVEVSAGGGTKIWVDEGGRLRVGPISAGADPGPACYGLGGKKPTLTDASLLLHRLGMELGGGEISLDPELAKTAIRKISSQIGQSMIKTSHSALRIANSKMGKAMRIATVERGFDPREFTLVAFGGMGPMVAPFLAEELRIKKVLVPPYPGVFSSLGLLLSNFKRTFTSSLLSPLTELTIEQFKQEKRKLENEAGAWLSNVSKKETTLNFTADMRYPHQSWELMVSIPHQINSLQTIEHRFQQKYQQKYGYTLKDSPEIVNLRITAIGYTEKPKIKFWKQNNSNAKIKTSRRVYFKEEWYSTPIYSLENLCVNQRIEGPSIFEGTNTSVVLPPGWMVEVHPSYLLEKREN